MGIFYMPILKGKTGEFTGLGQLPVAVKEKLLPFFDIPNQAVESSEEPPASLDDYLKKKVKRIQAAWANMPSRPVVFDLFDMDLKLRACDQRHPVTLLADLLKSAGLKGIPTAGFDRVPEYLTAVRNAVASEGGGTVCLRLLRDDMNSPTQLASNIAGFLADYSIARDCVHLLLDFREIGEDERKAVSLLAARTINALPSVMDFRSLTIAGSGMPQSLAKAVKADTFGPIDRTEMLIWSDLNGSVKRTPSFGDYGVVHPDHSYPDSTPVSASATIRYTLGDHWLIARGHSLKKTPKFGQFLDLSKKLVKRPDFLGATYSWGDAEIDKRACGRKETPGNLTTWVAVATNHHLTFVANQISEAAA